MKKDMYVLVVFLIISLIFFWLFPSNTFFSNGELCGKNTMSWKIECHPLSTNNPL